MGTPQTTVIADSRAPGADNRSAQDVDAGIAAWRAIVGDRNSRLHRILRGVAEPETAPTPLMVSDIDVDYALLRRLLIGLTGLTSA
ncbi:MAG: hypothetical protein LBO20_09740 [Bifidobacteriaceae bacterium]|jgi:hypothetical protein|nr:hypothetical protein [Bifidobacteriaceae bacterium]